MEVYFKKPFYYCSKTEDDKGKPIYIDSKTGKEILANDICILNLYITSVPFSQDSIKRFY